MEKTICSGIPMHRILDYFDQRALEASTFIGRAESPSSEGVIFAFETYKIHVIANPKPDIIRPVVPMTDLCFSGEELSVDAAIHAYRMFFMSAGG